MVFYRKYRPQTISELDSKEVRDTLTSVLSKKETPHAFLFTGPKGLGKTSTARIVAKAVNCEKKEKNSVEPCNACDQCTSITNGNNLDILEIDAASNRGIDEIRDLREKIRLAPLSARKKIYIIDEVHMLTTEAFNALLKTLEEPPAHVVFILCTTESHKVPPTILSRCFHIQFTLATSEELMRSFKRIVQAEKIKIDDETLSYITKLSDGSFRDGTKLLEELFLQAGSDAITQELVEKKFNIPNISSYIASMMDALKEKKTKEALEIIDTLVVNGSDLKFFIEELLKALHSTLLESVNGRSKSGFSLQEIQLLVPLLNKAYMDIKFSPVIQLPLELAVIEFTQNCGKEVSQTHEKNAEQSTKSVATSIQADTKSVGNKTEDTNTILQDLIQQLRSTHPSLVGLLRGCTVQKYDNKVLVLSTKYSYHQQRLADSKMLSVLKDAAEKVSGNQLHVEIELKG